MKLIAVNKFFLIVVLLSAVFVNAQIRQSGCTDPTADNYSPVSAFDDGSCKYDHKRFGIAEIARLSAELREISGMVYWNGKLYGHQDSGGDAALYELDAITGAITKTIALEGVRNIDWEDMTQDDTHFYIGDVGNNVAGNRQDLKIYKIPKGLITDEVNITIPLSEIGVIDFTYEEQTDFTEKPNNATDFDCEALAYNGGILHLFTKNWIGKTTTHYTLPTTPGTYKAVKKETFDTGTFKITGADFAPSGLLVLTGYQITGLPLVAVFLDYAFDGTYSYLNTGRRRRLDLGTVLDYGQVEAIAMKNTFEGFISNENFKKIIFNIPQRLYSFNILNHIRQYYENHEIEADGWFNLEKGTIRYGYDSKRVEIFDGTHWVSFL